MSGFVQWVKDNWRTPVGVVLALVLYAVVMVLATVAVMVTFSLPVGAFGPMLAMALLAGLVDRRAATPVSEWLYSKLVK